jgi:RHS repeat-associated protein
VATANLGSFTPLTSLPLYIGARPSANIRFKGFIDEPQVFNRALSPAEILSIFTAGTAGNCKPNGPQPPVVSAGLDQTIFLPTTQVTLHGTATDPAGSPLAVSWSEVSGPGRVTFANPLSTTTTATFTLPGVYVLRLTASNAQLTASNQVTITVSQVVNQPPVVSAGPNQTIQFPANTVTLSGTVTDDGLPVGGTLTQQWSKLSGPGTVTFSAPTQTTTQATFSAAATYLLQLTASDSQLSSSSAVSVTVLQNFVGQPANGTVVMGQIPVVPGSGVNLASGVLDFFPVSNPSNVTVINSNTTGSGAIGTFDGTTLANGAYILRLTATDTSGNQQVTLTTLSVIGENKPGRVTATVTDLQIPLGGIPITIARTYDSLERGRVEDFGFGWSLSVGVKLEVDAANNVTFTLNGRRQTFFFQPQASSFLFPWLLLPNYTPQAGLHGTLTSDGCGGLVQVQGALTCFPSGAYQPTTYTYTDISGTKFIMGADGNLRSIQDFNGNIMTVTPNGITSTNGINVPFQRDGLGRITQITDPLGKPYQYSYDGNGNLGSVTYPGISKPISYNYDANHLLTGGVDANNNPLPTNTYDVSGRAISQTDALGNTTSYAYSTATINGIVASTIVISNPPDANGKVGTVTIVRDSFGRPLSITDPLGHTTNHTYDASHNLLSTTDPLNHTTSYTYDAKGNQTSVTYPTIASSVNTTVTTTYNQFSEPVSQTDQLGNVQTTTYDQNSLPQIVTDTVNGSPAVVASFNYNVNGTQQAEAPGFDLTAFPNKATTFTYDANGNLSSATDPLGRVTAYNYDNFGLLRSVIRPMPVTTSSASSNTTTYKYDDFGRLIEIAAPLNRVTKYTYDNNSNRTSITDPNGNTTTFQYDALNRRVLTTYPTNPPTTQRRSYDFGGRLIDSTDPAGHITHRVYDLAGRLIAQTSAFGTPDASTTNFAYYNDGRVRTQTDPLGNTTTFVYDEAGRQASVTDALGHKTINSYDGANRLIATTDANQHTTKFSYDSRGRLQTTTYPDSTTNSQAYDSANNLISVTDQAGAKVLYTYNNVNQLVSVIQANHPDPAHNTTAYTYDNLENLNSSTDANTHQSIQSFDVFNELTSETFPVGGSNQISYDAAGNMLSLLDFKGKTTSYSFDPLNRVTRETPDPSLTDPAVSFTYTSTGQIASMTDSGGAVAYTYDNQDRVKTKSTPAGTLTYTYDAAGNLVSMSSSNSNGVSVSYTYDQLNRLSTVTDNRLPAGQGTSTYVYDPVSNLVTVTLPNGIKSTSTYDSLDRLISRQTAAGGSSTVASYNYQRGPTGNLAAVTELSGRSAQWSYDGIYRLMSETVSQDPNSKNGTVSYGLDPVGNRLSTTSNLFGITSAEFTYNANDFLNITESYDNNGNVTVAGGKAFGYDFQNRLISVTNLANNSQISLAYDALGNRVSKTVAGVNTQYLMDEQNPTGLPQVVEEVVSGSVQRTYAYGYILLDQIQSINGAMTASFYGYDGGGNVRFLTDAAGAVTDTYDYDAFGNLLNVTGATPNNYLYRGEQFDPDLGLYYLRARYYNPATGRFLTRDPEAGNRIDPGTLHRYIYATADPINQIDPTGRTATVDEGIDFDRLLRLFIYGLAIYAAAVACLYSRNASLINIGLAGLDRGLDLVCFVFPRPRRGSPPPVAAPPPAVAPAPGRPNPPFPPPPFIPPAPAPAPAPDLSAGAGGAGAGAGNGQGNGNNNNDNNDDDDDNAKCKQLARAITFLVNKAKSTTFGLKRPEIVIVGREALRGFLSLYKSLGCQSPIPLGAEALGTLQ